MAFAYNPSTSDDSGMSKMWEMMQSIYFAFNCAISNQMTENKSHNAFKSNNMVCLRTNNIQVVNGVSDQVYDQAVGGPDDGRETDVEEETNERKTIIERGAVVKREINVEEGTNGEIRRGEEVEPGEGINVGDDIDSGTEINARTYNSCTEISDIEVAPKITTRARYTYELDRYKKNAALIFVQIPSYCERRLVYEAIYDLTLLQFSLKRFRFEVDICFNLTCREIDTRCVEFFQQDFSKHGAVLVMVLTSNGRTGHLMASDGYLNESVIVRHFTTDLPSTLRYKPKIYITEANREINFIGDGNKNNYQISCKINENYKDILTYHIPCGNSSSELRPLITLLERISKCGEEEDLASIFDDAKQDTGQLKSEDMEIQINNTLTKEVRLAKIIPHTGND